MKARWLGFCLWIVLGLALLGCGLLVPAHLRAVDAGVILSAGRKGESVLERGRDFALAGRLGAAAMYVDAAHQLGMPGWDRLGQTVTNRAAANPAARFWGNDARTHSLFNGRFGDSSFSAFLIQRQNREAALAHLQSATAPAEQALNRCRSLERTTLFPPSASPSGQALDAALAEAGLLLEANALKPAIGESIGQMAQDALHGGGSQPLEEALMDLVALGEHLNWDQLTALTANVPDADALHALSAQVSEAGGQLPVLYAAAELSGEPGAVSRYLARYPQTGLADFSASLWYGANGVRQLADDGRRFYRSSPRQWLAAREPFGSIYYFTAAHSLEHPWLVLAAKWLCYLGAGISLAEAARTLQPPVSGLELPLQVRGFRAVREFLFAVGFLLAVLLLSEPFLAQENQAGGFTLRLHLPMAGGAVAAGFPGVKETVMNPTIMLTLLVFFVLQALIYISCLVKLAEIRRQNVPPRIKLKLLENEDHLFDAGLYLGFVGTIISLIVASMGLVKFSLMAAYSSTSFGIIFVVIFKIFHLRPARRKLLLEAELVDATATPAPLVAPQSEATPVLTS
jgi:hypothetical protein